MHPSLLLAVLVPKRVMRSRSYSSPMDGILGSESASTKNGLQVDSIRPCGPECRFREVRVHNPIGLTLGLAEKRAERVSFWQSGVSSPPQVAPHQRNSSASVPEWKHSRLLDRPSTALGPGIVA
jgi:hypothetical protein